MTFDDFPGMPSGTDYGTVLNWSLLDSGDFIVAFFAKGNPFDPIENDVFSWVVEDKNGVVVYLDNHVPTHRPVFGLDEEEWQNFKDLVLVIVDNYLEDVKCR